MKLKMIINPVSGRHKTHGIKAAVIERLRKRYALSDNDFFYTGQKGVDFNPLFLDKCDAVMVAGGDGTLHYAINKIKQLGVDVPLAYLPTGTVNDFGNYLKLPQTPDKFFEMLERGETRKVDIGHVDNKYFHYVVAGGALNSVSYTTNQYLKNMIGEKAYYLSVLPKLPQILAGTHIKIECDEICQEQDALLYLVTNSSVIGGIDGLVPEAKIDDGYLHVLVIKKGTLFNIVQLLFDIRNGTHLTRPDVLYFKTKQLSITQRGLDTTCIGIDGEMHNTSLTNIQIIPQGLTIMVPPKSIGA